MTETHQELCGKILKCGVMSEARPCIRPKNHFSRHTPDLVGLKFGNGVVLSKAKPYVSPDGVRHTAWNFQTHWGVSSVSAESLLSGNTKGLSAPKLSKLGVEDARGRTSPEYTSIVNHWHWIFNPKRRNHRSYKNMVFYDAWNPDKGGAWIVGLQWMRKHMPRPGLRYQLHVLKTKKYPHGFFGPGGIVWRSKMDSHDQNLLDLVFEWPNEKFERFVEQEFVRRKAVA